MGGVIGATSSKFVMAAAALCLPARVDRHYADAIVDFGAPVSTVSAAIADKLPGNDDGSHEHWRLRRPASIQIGAENMDVDALARMAGNPSTPCGLRDLVIGRDVLEHHIFVIDFARRTIRIVLGSELRSETKRRRLVQLSHVAGPVWRIPLLVDGRPSLGILDLNATSPAPGPGGVRILSGQIGSGAPAGATVGLGYFSGASIVLDLGHDRLWIGDPAHSRTTIVDAANPAESPTAEHRSQKAKP